MGIHKWRNANLPIEVERKNQDKPMNMGLVSLAHNSSEVTELMMVHQSFNPMQKI